MQDIELKNIEFAYRNSSLLQNINMSVESGEIFSLLGRNGAGKTTIIKLILGVLSPTYGGIKLFNEEITPLNRHLLLQKVGSLIETASVYEHLSAIENLRIASAYYENPYPIDKLLDIVNLAHKKHTKVKEFSLGMKQRLGIAMAMIGDPSIVILDEPTNGLDPEGIADIRNLIIELNQNLGKTFFVSSHLLSEVEKISTNLCIIEKGEMLYCGKMKNILATNSFVEIRYSASNSVLSIAKVLEKYQIISSAENTIKLKVEDECTPHIVKELTHAGIDIFEIKQVRDNLEDTFLNLIHNHSNKRNEVF